jgi:hypothetical protein
MSRIGGEHFFDAPMDFGIAGTLSFEECGAFICRPLQRGFKQFGYFAPLLGIHLSSWRDSFFRLPIRRAKARLAGINILDASDNISPFSPWEKGRG